MTNRELPQDDSMTVQLVKALHEIATVSESPAGAAWERAATEAMSIARRAIQNFWAWKERADQACAQTVVLPFAHGQTVYWPQPPGRKAGLHTLLWTVGEGQAHAFTVMRTGQTVIHIVADGGIVQVPACEVDAKKWDASKRVILLNESTQNRIAGAFGAVPRGGE